MNKTVYITILAAGLTIFGTLGVAEAGKNMASPQAVHQSKNVSSMGCPCPVAFDRQEDMTPEKMQAYQAIMKEYRLAVGPFQDQLKAKRLELKALSKLSAAQPEQISRVAGEIGSLMTQMRTAKNARNERLEKELGIFPDQMARMYKHASMKCPAVRAGATAQDAPEA